MLTETQGQDLMNGGQKGKQAKQMEPMKAVGGGHCSGETREDENSPLRPFALPQVESVASSTELVSSENQEIPGGLSFFLLCEMTLNKSRNLAL